MLHATTILTLAVMIVHGPPAIAMIYGGALLLVSAIVWNIFARRSCLANTDLLPRSDHDLSG
jgi:hypothetical protein